MVCVSIFQKCLICYNVCLHFVALAQLSENMGLPASSSCASVSHLLLSSAFHFFTCSSSFDLLTWFSFSNRFTLSSAGPAPSSQLSLSYLPLSISIFELYPFIPDLLHPLQSSSVLHRGGRERAGHSSSTKWAACSLHQRTSGIEGSKAGELRTCGTTVCGTSEFFSSFFPPLNAHISTSLIFFFLFSFCMVFFKKIVFKWDAKKVPLNFKHVKNYNMLKSWRRIWI